VAGWRAQAVVAGDHVLRVRYADLVQDLEGSVRRIAAFCRITLDAERLARTVERSRFDFMRQHARDAAGDHRPAQAPGDGMTNDMPKATASAIAINPLTTLPPSSRLQSPPFSFLHETPRRMDVKVVAASSSGARDLVVRGAAGIPPARPREGTWAA
jgi:Sulfotransferase domain